MVGFHESDDECAVCVHEHENWGDNEYCKKCKIEEMREKLAEHCLEQARYCLSRNIRNGCIFCVLRDNENPHCFHHVTDKELIENYHKVFN